MAEPQDILDLPKPQVEAPNSLESQILKDWAIVIGLLFTLLGLLILYVLIDSMWLSLSDGSTYESEISLANWYRLILSNFILLLWDICFIGGGIGLMLRVKMGWVFGFTAACFSLFMTTQLFFRTDYYGNSLIPTWIAILCLLVFGGIIYFLLLKKLRSGLGIQRKQFYIMASIFSILTIGLFGLMYGI